MEELYRKYRPQTLEEMVGNKATIKSVKAEIEKGSHVFLFTGNAGTGKTTLARIMAKEVGASDLSIHEINSAENRGIDTARDIMDKMKYVSADGASSVWILDEMHQITSAGQNALLKALEDTPSYCYFFLCTTDPKKLIAPLKTRCSIINMQPLTDDEMKSLLLRTAHAEERKLTKAVAMKIIELAGGGSRKALKLLSKVLYLDDEEEKLELLNMDEEESTDVNFPKILMNPKSSWYDYSTAIKSLDMSDPEKIRLGVMGYANAILLNFRGNADFTRAVNLLQAFSSNPTINTNNGRYAITVAVLDFMNLCENQQ